MRYLIEIEYDGSDYQGWQKQKDNSNTIQETIETALKIYLRDNIKIFVAGRTDAKVHAFQQFAHFDYEYNIDFHKFIYSINALLKLKKIIIKNISNVDDDFHSRFSCSIKEYKYLLLIDNKDNVFLNNRYWKIHNFDIKTAQECANHLIGTHDFSSFRDSHCQAKSPIRTINNCFFIKENNLITFHIQAKSFLHHQIRIIVGTIFDIIINKNNSEDFLKILNAKDRKKAGRTAPAKGLFLNWIKY